MAAVHLGLNQWGDVHCSDAAHANFQATDWGTSRVAAGSGDFNADIRSCTLGANRAWTHYTWFKFERDASDEFSAYWNPSLSDTLPSTGWLHMSTFTYSKDAPDRIALYQKTNTATTSTCSFRSFSLTSLTPPPPAPFPQPFPPPQLIPVHVLPLHTCEGHQGWKYRFATGAAARDVLRMPLRDELASREPSSHRAFPQTQLLRALPPLHRLEDA